MKSLRLRGKLTVAVTAIILATVIVLATVSYLSLQYAYERTAKVTREKLDQMIQSQVECMTGVLQANYERFQNGEISEEEARGNAAYLVRSSRYNDGVGYFWADMADGTSAVHIKPEVEGTNRYNTQDEKGNYFVQDTIQAGDKPGGGFIDFYFTKPGETEPKAKRGFVKKFEPYGWYIGTGNYEEDMLPMIQSELDQSDSALKSAVVLMFLCGMAVLCIAVAVMTGISRRIVKPIETVSARLDQLSKGNLQEPVSVTDGKDETGILTRSLAQTVEVLRSYILNISQVLAEIDQGNLDMRIDLDYIGDFAPIKNSLLNTIEAFNTTFRRISVSADSVANGSSQVSVSAQALSQGATEQASSVEELAATIFGISDQVKSTAQSSQQARETVDAVGKQLLDSNQQMQEMTRAMGEISASSTEIGKIIKTIEDIAFQTNILALNAAVEAARAGAAGKGFAVVADEVRNLASKSSEASKSTSTLIESSLRSVENGTRIADETAASMLQVVEGTKEIMSQINLIAAASGEEATAIAQVTQGIDQIASVVQTNSATAEESAASSEELSGEAQVLNNLVRQYRLKTTA